MRLKKELILVICIVVFIVALELITNYISKKSVEKILNEINLVNEEIATAKNLKENNNLPENYKKELSKKIEKLKNNWFQEQDKLSLFAEHNELEKVSKCIIVLEENSKNEEYTIALQDGKEFVYWLNHFKEKDSLEWKNVF